MSLVIKFSSRILTLREPRVRIRRMATLNHLWHNSFRTDTCMLACERIFVISDAHLGVIRFCVILKDRLLAWFKRVRIIMELLLLKRMANLCHMGLADWDWVGDLLNSEWCVLQANIHRCVLFIILFIYCQLFWINIFTFNINFARFRNILLFGWVEIFFNFFQY